MQGKWCNGESSVLSNLLFNCMHQIFIHKTIGCSTDHRTYLCPSLNSRTHLRTTKLLIACFPYTSQSWQWVSTGFMFFRFKKRVTDRISHAAGFSIFLNIINTRQCVDTECLQIVSVPWHRINKLGTHVLLHDRSAAVAILANATYFLDNPRIW